MELLEYKKKNPNIDSPKNELKNDTQVIDIKNITPSEDKSNVEVIDTEDD